MTWIKLDFQPVWRFVESEFVESEQDQAGLWASRYDAESGSVNVSKGIRYRQLHHLQTGHLETTISNRLFSERP